MMKLLKFLISMMSLAFAEKRIIFNSTQIEGRVYLGSVARENEFPFMVSIAVFEFLNEYIFKSNCGGSIISENYILTAAHCVDGNLYDVEVFLGNNRRETGEKFTIIPGPNSIKLHEKYKSTSAKYDIALIKTSEITFSESIQKIVLPKKHLIFRKSYNGVQCLIAGWGATDPKDPNGYSENLLYAEMTAEDGILCQNEIICASGNVPGKLDALGDSGGPLFYYKSNGKPKAIGVLVGKLNGVPIFSRIPYHLEWINHNMQIMSS